MKRYGQVIKLKPEFKEKYLELHRNIWPEISNLIVECNIKNYSIFLKDNYLFAYFEYYGENFDDDMKKMSDDPINLRWWSLCKPCQEKIDSAGENEWWADMKEVFHNA